MKVPPPPAVASPVARFFFWRYPKAHSHALFVLPLSLLPPLPETCAIPWVLMIFSYGFSQPPLKSSRVTMTTLCFPPFPWPWSFPHGWRRQPLRGNGSGFPLPLRLYPEPEVEVSFFILFFSAFSFAHGFSRTWTTPPSPLSRIFHLLSSLGSSSENVPLPSPPFLLLPSAALSSPFLKATLNGSASPESPARNNLSRSS